MQYPDSRAIGAKLSELLRLPAGWLTVTCAYQAGRLLSQEEAAAAAVLERRGSAGCRVLTLCVCVCRVVGVGGKREGEG